MEPNQHVPPVKVPSGPLPLPKVLTLAPLGRSGRLRVGLQLFAAVSEEPSYEHALAGGTPGPPSWVTGNDEGQ